MGRGSGVAWREGLFLRPQHFQQQDRYLDELSLARTRSLSPHPWGIAELKIDDAFCDNGEIGIERCSGIFPDGTPFAVPSDLPPPKPVRIPADTRNAPVYLTLAQSVTGATEYATRTELRPDARYVTSTEEIIDTLSPARSAERVEIAEPNIGFGLTPDQLRGRSCIAIAQVREVLGGKVILDSNHIPPLLDIRGSVRLMELLREATGRMTQRVDLLALRAPEAAEAGQSGHRDLLTLLALNRWLPPLLHMQGIAGVHPERLYTSLVSIAGELCTFSRDDRRAPAMPSYEHERLRLPFEFVFDLIRDAVSRGIDPDAGMLPLRKRERGGYIAVIDQHLMIESRALFLAVAARVPLEQIRQRIPKEVKIGAMGQMDAIVNAKLSTGVTLFPTPTPPPQIRVLPGYVYFELDRSSEAYGELVRELTAGLHIAGEWPDLKLELWWVKTGR